MIPPDPRETRLAPVVAAVRQLAEGRSNAAGQATLRANQTTTVVASLAIAAGSLPQLTPASASAAGEWANGTIYVSAVAAGSFTITHASAASTDRRVNWHAVGG